jgi:hypothetical protein
MERKSMTRPRTVTPLFFSAAVALACGFAIPAQAGELRIGLIVSMTGIFAQAGKE